MVLALQSIWSDLLQRLLIFSEVNLLAELLRHVRFSLRAKKRPGMTQVIDLAGDCRNKKKKSYLLGGRCKGSSCSDDIKERKEKERKNGKQEKKDASDAQLLVTCIC